MTIRKLITTGVLFFIVALTTAQTKSDYKTQSFNIGEGDKEITIEDAVIGQYRSFYPEYLINVRWKDANNYTSISDYKNIELRKIGSKKSKTLFTLDQLNAMYNKAGLDSLRYIVAINWLDQNHFSHQQSNVFVIIDSKKKKITKIIKFNEAAQNIEYQKEVALLTYTVDNNLYVNDGENEIAITKDTDKGLVNGQTVHRSEFGITGGIFWSPKGSLLAYYHKDETMVSKYPLIDITERVAENKPTVYAMAGMKSEEVLVAIYNPKTNKSIYLKTGEPKEQYLTNVTWSPDEKSVYIQVLNREQNHMKLNQYNAETGEFVKTLFEEKDDRWVEPEHHLVFLKDNNDEFLYFSEKDGFMHLYRYNTKGELLNQVTKGEWIVNDFVGFDQAGKKAIVYTTTNGPIEKQAYTVEIETGKMTLITPEKGKHSVFLNPYKDVFVDGFSSITTPHNYSFRDFDGKNLGNILNAENPYKDYKLGEMTIGTIKSADKETDLYYRLITPPNYDKNKKYPAIVYVYGGPHAQMITDFWLASSQLWLFYMAQKGYVILTVDNRGSGNRAKAFESIIHRNLGDAEMADQMQGIDLLKSLGYVDMDRIGVDGWSYGGFMTTNLMLTHSDVFKVGAAGGPVIDWKFYEIMYGERYMDMPDENPEGYEKANLSKRVTDLQGRLLIIHGAQDPTVVWQHSQVFIRECVKNDIMLDYFIYPTHEHNVRGKDRVHLMKKITRYFDDFL